MELTTDLINTNTLLKREAINSNIPNLLNGINRSFFSAHISEKNNGNGSDFISCLERSLFISALEKMFTYKLYASDNFYKRDIHPRTQLIIFKYTKKLLVPRTINLSIKLEYTGSKLIFGIEDIKLRNNVSLEEVYIALLKSFGKIRYGLDWIIIEIDTTYPEINLS